jgi:serine/threonine protein kinase
MDYLTHGKPTAYAVVQAIQCTEAREGFDGYMAVKSCLLKDKDAKDQAYNELEQLLRLRHNHIVALVGSYEKRTSTGAITTLGLVMFPVAAWDLAKYLSVISAFNKRAQETSGESPVQSLICHDYIPHLRSFFACLCQALLYLHSKRIKHRDIKPANVLIDMHQVVMFADFGIAKSYKTQAEARTDGPTWMTIHYAPRQAFPKKGQPKEKRGFDADIFSLGCVFLEMVTVLMGESLEELWKFVFPEDPVDQGSSIPISAIYWQHLDAVAEWIDHLREFREYRIEVIGTRDNACIEDDILDTIFQMMSNEPHERPSLYNLWGTFNGLALSPCKHCHPKASGTQLVG